MVNLLATALLVSAVALGAWGDAAPRAGADGRGQVAGTLVDASGAPVDGQVLLWAGLDAYPDDGIFPRPTEAVDTSSGPFSVDVDAGDYLVRATVGGKVCVDTSVTVAAGAVARLDATCG